MGSFYVISSGTRIFFTVFSLASLLIHTLSLLLLFARLDSEKRFFGKSFEVMLVLHLALMAFLLTALQDQTLQANTALTAHTAVRWAGVLTMCLGACCAVFEKHSRRVLTALAVLFTAITLPCFDALFDRGFAWVFMSAVVFFLLRGIDIFVLDWRYLKNNVSRLSIKEALDTLHGGLLFADSRGRIVLQNSSMLALIHRIAGKPVTDANDLWIRLSGFGDTGIIAMTKLADKLLIRLQDASWEFSKETIAACGRAYILISAADVTETDRITQRLAAVTSELVNTAGELQYVIDHYEEIKSAREAVTIKRRIHDVVGQRISILNQTLLNAPQKEFVLDDIVSLLSDLMKDIREQETDCPDAVLFNMKRSFSLAGAELIIKGVLPESGDQAFLLLKVVREAATNAIRHASATQIRVHIRKTAAGYTMIVTDNGKPPAGTVTEGGGIMGMRERLMQAGGTLSVESVPVFKLTAELPE